MTRIGGVWDQLMSFDNLLRASRKARRGKRGRSGVAEFGLNLERELLALRRELHADTYVVQDARALSHAGRNEDFPDSDSSSALRLQ